MNDLIDLKTNIEKVGMKAKGRAEMFKHLNGERLSRGQALKAVCYDCMGWFSDGKMDCGIPTCAAFPFRPYKGVQESN